MEYKQRHFWILVIWFYAMLHISCASGGTKGCIDPSKVNPGPCTREYRPVCGCDGKTYGNACEAEREGLNSWKEGSCE